MKTKISGQQRRYLGVSADLPPHFCVRHRQVLIDSRLMKITLNVVLLSLAALGVAGSVRASGVMEPSPILRITKIVPKPGAMAEVRNIEAERTAAFRNAKWPRTFISASAVTGPAQIWILTRYARLAEIQEDIGRIEASPELSQTMDRLDAAEGALLASKRDVTVTYQKNISYRPAFDWSTVRYWEIIWIHLRQGHHDEYIQNRIMTREEHERGGFDTHQMMYAVQSGEQSGTFMVIRPRPALGLLDTLHAANDGEPATPEEEKKKTELFAASSMTEEEAYFRVDPALTSLQ